MEVVDGIDAADGEDAVHAKRAFRLASDVVADDVPDAAMIDDALRAQGALYRLVRVVDELEALVRATDESQR